MKDITLTTISLLFIETLLHLYHFYLDHVCTVLFHSVDNLLHLTNNLWLLI